MTQKFQQADLVKLKSGGPIMTVKDYLPMVDVGPLMGQPAMPDVPTEKVRCTWFEGNDAKHGTYHESLLDLAFL